MTLHIYEAPQGHDRVSVNAIYIGFNSLFYEDFRQPFSIDLRDSTKLNFVFLRTEGWT